MRLIIEITYLSFGADFLRTTTTKRRGTRSSIARNCTRFNTAIRWGWIHSTVSREGLISRFREIIRGGCVISFLLRNFVLGRGMPRRWTLSSCIVHRLDTPLLPPFLRANHIYFYPPLPLLSSPPILSSKNPSRSSSINFLPFLPIQLENECITISLLSISIYIYISLFHLMDGKATFSPKSLRNPRFLRFEKRWPRPRFSLARGNEITLIQRFRTVRLFPSAGQWSVVSRLDFRFWPGDDAASRSCPRGVFHSPSTRGGSRLSQGGRGREGGNLRPGTVAPRN